MTGDLADAWRELIVRLERGPEPRRVRAGPCRGGCSQDEDGRNVL